MRSAIYGLVRAGVAPDRVDEVMLPSVFGSTPTDVYYEFAPLSQLGEKEAAEVDNKNADTFKKYADTGLLPDAALVELRQRELHGERRSRVEPADVVIHVEPVRAPG